MGTRLIRSVLGLSIAVGGLIIARPASATIWKNFANEAFCLSTNGGSTNPGTALVIRTCDGGADQNWGEVNTPWSTNYTELYNMSAAAPPPFAPSNARCAGASGGTYGNGVSLIIWGCNNVSQSHDQGWHRFISGFTDNLGHQCYYFKNELAWEATQGISTEVIGVSAGIMTNNRPLILWEKFATGHHDQMWCQY
jgi:hypothetical protein